MRFNLDDVKTGCIEHIKFTYCDCSEKTIEKKLVRFNDNFITLTNIITDIESNALWRMIVKTTPKDTMMETLGNDYHSVYNALDVLIDRLESHADKMMYSGCVPGYVIEYYQNRYYNFYYYA